MLANALALDAGMVTAGMHLSSCQTLHQSVVLVCLIGPVLFGVNPSMMLLIPVNAAACAGLVHACRAKDGHEVAHREPVFQADETIEVYNVAKRSSQNVFNATCQRRS